MPAIVEKSVEHRVYVVGVKCQEGEADAATNEAILEMLQRELLVLIVEYQERTFPIPRFANLLHSPVRP